MFRLHCSRRNWSRMDPVKLALILIFLAKGSECVRLIRLGVPSHRFLGDSVVLQCLYDLEGERLYSVKWYKDHDEFFRFIPAVRDTPITVFRLPGVRVWEQESNQTSVVLHHLTVPSAGTYRCEVSAEAPLFNTVSRSSRMEIVVLPKDRPRISGGRPHYRLGERVRVNCTSDRSKPAANLHWYINGELAPEDFLRHYRGIQHEDGLTTSILGLDFPVDRDTFEAGVDVDIHGDVSDGSGRKRRRRRKKFRGGTHGGSGGKVRIHLRCASSVSTVNAESQTTETHHQKSAEHLSFGSLFSAAGKPISSISVISTMAVFVLRGFARP